MVVILALSCVFLCSLCCASYVVFTMMFLYYVVFVVFFVFVALTFVVALCSFGFSMLFLFFAVL